MNTKQYYDNEQIELDYRRAKRNRKRILSVTPLMDSDTLIEIERELDDTIDECRRKMVMLNEEIERLDIQRETIRKLYATFA